jgi:Rrf2 family protein
MILSQTSEYAIRAMSTVATIDQKAPISAKNLSAETGIPVHYLSKIMRKLVEKGLLSAEKGHRGGFTLAKTPQRIRIIDVIEAVEAHVPVKHCIFGWRACNSQDPCILHHRWSEVNDAFQRWARQTSLSDVKNDAVATGWMSRTLPKKRGKKC